MPWTLMSLQHMHTHHELDSDVSCTAVIAADMQMQEDKQRTLSGAHEATCSWTERKASQNYVAYTA